MTHHTPSLGQIPLFGQIRLDAPSAPGSASSAEGAASISGDQMQAEMKKVLTWYAAQSEPRTRHECAAVVYQGRESALASTCGRVNALVTLGYLEEVGRQGKRATLSITDAGRRKLVARAA
jgi:hypothetical protein